MLQLHDVAVERLNDVLETTRVLLLLLLFVVVVVVVVCCCSVFEAEIRT